MRKEREDGGSVGLLNIIGFEVGESLARMKLIYFFLVAFSAALVVLPPLPSDFSTDLMTPTATV